VGLGRAVDRTGGVVRCGELGGETIAALARRFGADAVRLAAAAEIPGSYWGAPEAGLVGTELFYRNDTPAHSFLHELSHFVCMTPERRATLDTDAGGDDDEECAVCYLEVLLAEHLAAYDGARCFADMDAWGYSFRQGSAQRWFAGDGLEARRWLLAHGLIDARSGPTWRLRGESGCRGGESGL
jgi:hypothetical protein